jgi:molecular chaperone DnaJ
MDFYAILGIPRDATFVEVKRAYRRLARRLHPDINPGDRVAAMRFRDVTQAYETLSDPEERRRYDREGVARPLAAEASVFEGFDFSAAVHANLQSTFGDLFAEVLRRTPQTVAPRGADLHTTITCSLDQAFAGADRPVTITRQDRCAACAGSGALHGSGAACAECHGAGTIRSARGHMVFARTCPRCGGAGIAREERCGMCAATGLQTRTEVVTVRVPPGIAEGTRLRVPDRGHAGLHGGPCGDLYVTVQVAPDPRFRRDGDDLHMVLPVAVHEAGLGTRLDVAGIDGAVRVRIPPGTQSGQRFRLRERGMPGAGGRRGDLVIEVRLMLPRLLDERSKELLREFGAINTESVRDFA